MRLQRRVCVCVSSHHKLLLCASHAGASLCVLVCSDQQLDQSGDGSLLPQWSVVCGAQSQVTDQTDCSLMGEHRCCQMLLKFVILMSASGSYGGTQTRAVMSYQEQGFKMQSAQKASTAGFSSSNQCSSVFLSAGQNIPSLETQRRCTANMV